MDRRDIRVIDAADIVGACGRVPDVLDGSPPCQDFSMAGKRTRGWGEERQHGDGTKQRSDDLFDHYTRLVRDLEPRVFVAENVRGLIAGSVKGRFKQIMGEFTRCGYRVEARLLDAQWLGVPQRRKRVLIVGVRNDLGLRPVFPTPLPYCYSILDACPWLADFNRLRGPGGFPNQPLHDLTEPVPTIMAAAEGTGRWTLHSSNGGHEFSEARTEMDEPAPTIDTRGTSNVVLRHQETRYKRGDSAQELDEPVEAITAHGTRGNQPHLELRHTVRPGNGRSGETVDLDGPMDPITAAGVDGLNKPHFTDPASGLRQRRLTIAEVKRLCSFPDDYVLTGSYHDQWARLGNSVPPLMMAALARALTSVLSG